MWLFVVILTLSKKNNIITKYILTKYSLTLFRKITFSFVCSTKMPENVWSPREVKFVFGSPSYINKYSAWTGNTQEMNGLIHTSRNKQLTGLLAPWRQWNLGPCKPVLSHTIQNFWNKLLKQESRHTHFIYTFPISLLLLNFLLSNSNDNIRPFALLFDLPF